MYIMFRSSSCRKNSLVSCNSLAVKENNVFFWIHLHGNVHVSVWWKEQNKPPRNTTKCEVFFKIQSIFPSVSVFTIFLYSWFILTWQLKHPHYFAWRLTIFLSEHKTVIRENPLCNYSCLSPWKPLQLPN